MKTYKLKRHNNNNSFPPGSDLWPPMD